MKFRRLANDDFQSFTKNLVNDDFEGAEISTPLRQIKIYFKKRGVYRWLNI